MPQIAGIATQKNANGDITHITIDVRKHRKMITPVLQQLGITEKSKFKKEREAGYTIEQTRNMLLDHIENIWKK